METGFFIGLIFSIIVFLIFIGMFIRLGRIEKVLISIAKVKGVKDFDVPKTLYRKEWVCRSCGYVHKTPIEKKHPDMCEKYGSIEF
jgi:hypothetical protein